MNAAADEDVSIVIATYNHAAFLSDSIQSALAQVARPLEIIVVDDGSSDDPAAIVALYPGVSLARQVHQGVSAARNTGWKAATGKFVAFLDADDQLRPNALAVNLRQFQERPECAFVYGGYAIIDEAGALVREVPAQSVGEDAFCSLLSGNKIGMHATVLYRRKLLEDVGGFDVLLRAGEDYDLYLKLARSHPVSHTTVCLADYRIHRTNMSHDTPLMLRASLTVLQKYRELARTRPAWSAAYDSGLSKWQRG